MLESPFLQLLGQKLAGFHLAFTEGNRAEGTFERLSMQVWDLEKAGPICRSKICSVSPVPCKRKVESCKFMSVQICYSVILAIQLLTLGGPLDQQ